MNKDSKSIFKMQEAGSIPEVNQYGLTEEQMQSVRDNMRLYKISEEEAVANKIKAMETSSDYGQKDAMLFDIKNSQRYLNNTMANAKNNISSYSALNYKPISFNPNDRLKDGSHINLDPNWRIKILMDLRDRDRVLGAQQRESKAYADGVIESSKDRNAQQNVLAENAASRLKGLNNGLYSRQNDYNTYKQEFLDSNPIGNYTKNNWGSELQSPTHMGGAIEDPTTVREQDAHNYAVSKIRDQYKDTNNNSYLSNYGSNYFTGEDLKNQYAANLLQKDSPFIRHSKSLQNVGDTALTAGATTLPLYLFAPEFATYKLAAIPRIAGEFAGAKIGEKLFSRAGRAIDQMRAFNRTRTGIRLGMEDPASYKPITSPAYIADKLAQRVGEPLDKIGGKETVSPGIRNAGNGLDSYEKVGHFLGGFGGGNKGEKVAYGLEKLGGASMLNKPWARKLPQGVVPNALKQDTFNTLLKYNLVHPKMKTTFVNDYQFLPNSSKPLLPSSTNSKNIIKNQLGGLIYKPYIPEQNESKQTSSTTLSYEPEDAEEESFQIEPVRIYSGPTSIIQEQEQEQESSEPVLDAGFTDKEMKVLYEDGSNEEKQRVSIKYLQQKLNLTKEQAAAIVGQGQRESHFRLNAENKEEKAGKNSSVRNSQYGIGIGQGTGSRHDEFLKYVNSHGGIANLKTQLDFAISEIKSNPDFLNNLRKAATVEDASAYTYVQYVAAQYKGIKDTNDLYSKVKAISESYKKKHQEMYGRSSDTFGAGLRNAKASLKLLG